MFCTYHITEQGKIHFRRSASGRFRMYLENWEDAINFAGGSLSEDSVKKGGLAFPNHMRFGKLKGSAKLEMDLGMSPDIIHFQVENGTVFFSHGPVEKESVAERISEDFESVTLYWE